MAGPGAPLRTICAILTMAAALGGCELLYAPQAEPPPRFQDPVCAAVARERADDARINGYDGAVALRTAQDSYAGCMRDKPVMAP